MIGKAWFGTWLEKLLVDWLETRLALLIVDLARGMISRVVGGLVAGLMTGLLVD